LLFSRNSIKEEKPNENPQPIPPSQEEPDNCPYNEKSLTEPSEISSKYGKKIAYSEDLQVWRQIPRDYIVKL
jgi:hypothetical protein